MRRGTKPLREGSKLDRGLIVDAAFHVLDAVGLDGLSLRLVAEHLNVQTPALYWHVDNKAALISHMAVALQQRPDAARCADWRDGLACYARALRRSLLQHRDSARLVLAARPLEDPDDVARRLIAPLLGSGLTAAYALTCHAAVAAFTVGMVAYDQSRGMHDFLSRMIDFDDSFEVGLQAMVSGLSELRDVKAADHQGAGNSEQEGQRVQHVPKKE